MRLLKRVRGDRRGDAQLTAQAQLQGDPLDLGAEPGGDALGASVRAAAAQVMGEVGAGKMDGGMIAP